MFGDDIKMRSQSADAKIIQSDLQKMVERVARNDMVLNASKVSTYTLV